KWARGEPLKLEAHLALNCSKVEDEVRQNMKVLYQLVDLNEPLLR
ncbi:9605_t:CDS:2, partial [Ambispora leptoticha]